MAAGLPVQTLRDMNENPKVTTVNPIIVDEFTFHLRGTDDIPTEVNYSDVRKLSRDEATHVLS